jgi:phage tail protein X
MDTHPVVIARQGETVDQIAARCYDGDTAMTALILAANHGLAAFGPTLPHGTPVSLPPRQVSAKKLISLWD